MCGLALMCAPHAHADDTSSTQETDSTAATSTEVTAPTQVDTAIASTTDATTTEAQASTTSSVIATDTSVVPEPVTITLDVETASTTLFNQSLTVTACPISPTSGTSTVSGYCALEQSGLLPTWAWYGDDAFLDSAGGVANDYATNTYWAWLSNHALGATALNKHEVHNGETLLVTLGVFPLRITMDSATPYAGATTTAHITHFAYDANYEAAWLPAASSTLHLGNELVAADAQGDAVFTAPLVSTDLYATKDGFLPSNHLTLTPTLPTENTSTGGASSGGGPSPAQYAQPPHTNTEAVAGAKAFLLSHLQDGRVGSDMITDWAAIALAPYQNEPLIEQLVAYEKQLTPRSLTDTQRHAMALEALSIDPHSYGLIAPIVASFDGTQFGDAQEVNDDIFALIALTHAGYSASDPLIQQDVVYILSKQEANGSWDSVDLTAAAIQALTPLTSIDAVSSALKKAAEFLDAHTDAAGCAGNVFSTSWVAMAQIALGKTASSCLLSMQQSDGGFGELSDTEDNRIWATAYALPVLQGTSWIQLHHFQKPTSMSGAQGGGGAPFASTTLAATSTLEATSTPPQILLLAEVAPISTSTLTTMLQKATSTPTTTVPPLRIVHAKKSSPEPQATQEVAPQTQAAAVITTRASIGSSIAHTLGALWHYVTNLFGH
ncbi:MAG: hypothetical protein QG621_379 [Patescibacteria group bacterium]|nr:hypothetical protein [Patescibacteria group bacterium]